MTRRTAPPPELRALRVPAATAAPAGDAPTRAGAWPRRSLLKALAGAFAGLAFPWPEGTQAQAAAGATPSNSGVPVAQRAWHRTYVAFCDTLVPADDLTPSASALGVTDTILADVEGDPDAERLLAAGCAWLDAEVDAEVDAAVGTQSAQVVAPGAFAAAGEAARVAACERMQAQPWESPAGRFFVVLRNTVLGEYYARPEAWQGLALTRPPQPNGFFEALGDGA